MFYGLIKCQPDLAVMIGRLLASYSGLEYALLCGVSQITSDIDSTLKAMYRSRGETQRIDVADAFGRQRFKAIGLGTEFEMAIGGMNHCRKIRNQYAHCNWYADAERAGFLDLEELARTNTPITGQSMHSYHNINLDLATRQLNYFNYVDILLWWLAQEADRKKGILPEKELPKPKQVEQPPFYIDKT